jgi:hypothetical protein
MPSDTDALQAVLTDARGQYVEHSAIISRVRYMTGHGLTVHSRAADLRKRGLNVECEVRTVNQRRVSFYRLSPLPSGAHPELCSGTECAPDESGETMVAAQLPVVKASPRGATVTGERPTASAERRRTLPHQGGVSTVARKADEAPGQQPPMRASGDDAHRPLSAQLAIALPNGGYDRGR